MREIKFRAYIKKSRKMVDVNVLRLQGWMIGNDGDSYNENEYILMQYTGLKDKNGKEIYEGDIVRWDDGTSDNIKWMDEFGCWGTEVTNFLCNCNFEQFAVIGNIYENPELLEDK